MIEVTNPDYFAGVLAEAAKRGLLHKLLQQLQYLNCYGNKNNRFNEEVSNDGRECDTTRVELGYDFAEMSFSILWKRMSKSGEWEAWMNGGLIFHEASENWSCHT